MEIKKPIKWNIIIMLALCHLVTDGICISYLYSHFVSLPDNVILISLIIYNFLAFAFQPIIGIIADIKKLNKPLLYLGLLLSAIAAFINMNIYLAAAIFGITNSMVHVGGAGITINNSEDRIAPLGVFVSLGALGIGIGALIPDIGRYIFGSLCIVILIISLLILKKADNEKHYEAIIKDSKYMSYDLFIIPVILLFVAVFLRGFSGYLASPQFNKLIFDSILIFMGVGIGKAVGGFIADKIGINKTIIIFFLPSLIIFGFFRDIKALYIIGLLLINITMPLTLYLIIKCVKDFRNFAFGLTAALLMVGTFTAQLITGYSEIIIIISIIISATFIIIAQNKLRRKKCSN